MYATPSDKFNMPSQPRFTNWKGEGAYNHLDGIDLEAIGPEEITVLIGANVPDALLCTDVRRGGEEQPLWQ